MLWKFWKALTDVWGGLSVGIGVALVTFVLVWLLTQSKAKGQYVPPYQRQQAAMQQKFEGPKTAEAEHPLAVPTDGRPIGWETWPSKRWQGMSLDQMGVLAFCGWVFVGLSMIARMREKALVRQQVGL